MMRLMFYLVLLELVICSCSSNPQRTMPLATPTTSGRILFPTTELAIPTVTPQVHLSPTPILDSTPTLPLSSTRLFLKSHCHSRRLKSRQRNSQSQPTLTGISACAGRLCVLRSSDFNRRERNAKSNNDFKKVLYRQLQLHGYQPPLQVRLNLKLQI
jgi:hypothetical protein